LSTITADEFIVIYVYVIYVFIMWYCWFNFCVWSLFSSFRFLRN